jgi:hypothetical protein
VIASARLSERRFISYARARLESGLLLWGLAAIFVLIQIASSLSQPHIDTLQIWTGLHRFLHGMSPYGVVTYRPFGYDHPPGSTLIDAPLGLLSVSAAGKVIVLVSGVGVMVAIVALTRGRDDLDPWQPALAAFVVSISRPFHEELSLGNLDLLALVSIAFGLVALGHRRERPGAVLMALGVCIKPTAAPILLAPLCAKRGRATGLALGLVAVATVAGFAIVPHSWRFFTSVVPFLTGPEQGKADYNGSLTGLVGYLGLGGSIPAAATQAAALLAVAVVWLRYRRELSRSLEASVALFAVAILLVPRYSFEVYGLYLVLALPFILQLRRPVEIALATIALWFLAIRDVLPLKGAIVDHFRELRPGLGHIAVGALIIMMLERQFHSEPAYPRGDP